MLDKGAGCLDPLVNLDSGELKKRGGSRKGKEKGECKKKIEYLTSSWTTFTWIPSSFG